MRALVVLVAVAACSKRAPADLDHDLIRVTNDARLRTDQIGDGPQAEVATFVFVEAENTAKDGAYVTLGGDLTDDKGTKLGDLVAQQLFVPAGETRSFALIDFEHKPRPNARGAHIYVLRARVAPPPPVRIADLRTLTDSGKTVVQGNVHNDADHGGSIMVVGTFYGPDNRPMTRPFSVVWIDGKQSLPIQFVGPPGSVRGTMFVGDTVY
jgi:hypothetical protein